MSTKPVVTVTDELLEELEQLASKSTGGEWDYHMGIIRTMEDSDGYVPVAVAPNAPSNWRGQRDTNMHYIALANPATILALLNHIRTMQQELKAAHISVDNCELFRKQAGRYQFWSRKAFTNPVELLKIVAPCKDAEELDEAIDAAMTASHSS